MHNTDRLRTLFVIMRPRFWLYTAGPFLLGFAARAQSIEAFTSFTFWIYFIIFLIPANSFIYAFNDYFDVETDAKNEKKKTHERAMGESERAMYRTIIMWSCMVLIVSSLFIPTIGKLGMGLFIFLGWAYSAPPIRLKTKPFADFMSNMLYVMPALVGLSLGGSDAPLGSAVWIALMSGALWTWGMHLFSAVPDIAADREVGVMTTAVRLGLVKSLLLCAFLWFLSAYGASRLHPVLWIGYVYPLVALGVLWYRDHIHRAYWLFPYLNALFGAILFFLIVLK